MKILCKVRDHEMLGNESEYKHYIATLRKKNDKSLYKKYTINNINLDEIDQILDDHTTSHNEKSYL